MREPDVVGLAADTTKLGFRKALRLKRDGRLRMDRSMADGSLFGSMAGTRQVATRAAVSNGVTAKCEAVRADACALKLRPKSRGIDTPGEKAMERAKGIEPSY